MAAMKESVQEISVCNLIGEGMQYLIRHSINAFLFYVIALILTTFYPLAIGTSHENGSQHYIPKSKREEATSHQRFRTKCKRWWRSSKEVMNRIIQYMCKQCTRVAQTTKRSNLIGWMPKYPMHCMEIITMQASEPKQKGARMIKFDTDSASIGIDNRCSGCISHRVEDFEGPLIDTNKSIRGFGGVRTYDVKMGTVRWKWLDDTGAIHTFRIPNSYYIPSGKVRLLSPQHWAKAINGNNLKKSASTGETTTGDKTVLFWGNNKYKLTVPMCPKTNVATFQTAPGYYGYKVFCHQAEIDNNPDSEPLIAQQGMQDDDESEDDEIGQLDLSKIWPSPNSKNISEERLAGKNDAGTVTDGQEINRKRNSMVMEFLDLHNKAGHTSFAKLKVMAKQGIIPSKYASCPTPVCPACMLLCYMI